jgi:ADP-ribose pyrophosphatase YjhB (NUDIX family)
MLRRFNTGWQDGTFTIPSGHLEANETVTQGAIREIKEEAGVIVRPEDLEMVHVMHRREGDERIDFFFLVKNWEGEPRLTEPDKSDEVLWAFPQQLPENTVDYLRYFFEQWAIGLIYSERASQDL